MRQAAIQMTVIIDFEDNGEDDLKDQARDQFMMDAPSEWASSIDIEKIWIEPQEPSNG